MICSWAKKLGFLQLVQRWESLRSASCKSMNAHISGSKPAPTQTQAPAWIHVQRAPKFKAQKAQAHPQGIAILSSSCPYESALM